MSWELALFLSYITSLYYKLPINILALRLYDKNQMSMLCGRNNIKLKLRNTRF